MKLFSNPWHRGGGVALLIVIACVVSWCIWKYGNSVGLDNSAQKITVTFLSLITIGLIRVVPSFISWTRQKTHQQKGREENTYPEQEARLVQPASHRTTIVQLKETLSNIYGRFWFRKVRILLLTGNPADVEQLVPKLTEKYWQEDNGTVLLWGGDLGIAITETWLNTLGKLRYRPLDGIVWVTSALVKSTTLGQKEVKTTLSIDKMDSVVQAFSASYTTLGWRFPLYVWSLHDEKIEPNRITQSIGCLLPVNCKPDVLQSQLTGLVPFLIEQGTQQIIDHQEHVFLLQLATQLANHPDSVTSPLCALLTPYNSLALAGVIFSPVSDKKLNHIRWHKDNRWDLLLKSLSSLPVGLIAKKLGFAWQKTLVITTTGVMLLWGIGMVMAFLVNRNTIVNVESQVKLAMNVTQPLSTRLISQLDLQHTLDRLQHQQQEGTPWYSRFGLNQNDELLTTLWPHYGASALPLLRDAASHHLETQLETLVQLPVDSPNRDKMLKLAYNQLKLYLMLVQPEKMDALWFSKTLHDNWPQRDGVQNGVWQGSGLVLLDFYARHLPTHPDWRLIPNEHLVSQVRMLLVRQLGARNSESSLYQKILHQVTNQYTDMHLSDMTGDTDSERLFTTDLVVPGIFTRKAWEETVKPAIEQVVSERKEEIDWVLSDSKNTVLLQDTPEALQARLKERYFADFSGKWLEFLNSLQWQQAQTLSDVIEQLALMADVRQSPLVALMNTLDIQGKTGLTGEALSDSLVKSAQNLLNHDEKPAIDQQIGNQGPLDATFGPVLSLMKGSNGKSEIGLNLQTFLTRVTQVRLKLQQVVNAADPQAMAQTLAQTVFQGRAVDLTETRDYGSLVAASLGQEWSSFGQTVFVQPMEQAWQQILSPAAESLNTQWKAAVVDDWNSTFGGRYPLKETSSEISIPLLARYLNNDSGRITQFLQTHLNGVLHKEGSRWVPDRINAQGLTFNPAFLKAIDMLSSLSEVAFTGGEVGMHFELRPGTAKEVMQTDLIIDGQKLSYYNQLPIWKRLVWPHDTEAPGASLSWISTQAGTRQYADLPGVWGLIRLLGKAEVTPYQGVNSSFNIVWTAPDGRLLNYTLRTEAGEGPLALLKLRNFTLPAQIFNANSNQNIQHAGSVMNE